MNQNKQNQKGAAPRARLPKTNKNGNPVPVRPPRLSAMAASRGDSGQVAAASAYSSAQRTRAPMISRSARGMRIVHSELVRSVNGSVAFTPIKVAVNPGLDASFPWLAPQAKQWEQYRMHRCAFRFVTRTGTTTVGSVILAPDYDVLDTAPTTEAQVTSFQNAVEDAAWRDQTCRLDPEAMHPLGPRKYVRSAAVGADLKTYDVANLYLCTVEEVGADAIGKLWVDYDIEFFVPQTGDSTASSESTTFRTQVASQSLATGVSEPVEFDTLIVDPLGIGAPVVGVFTPPAGAYDIDALVCVSDTAAELLAVTLRLFKNGAALTPNYTASMAETYAATGPTVQIGMRGYVICNGTDTFAIMVTATGAAGTLVCVANQAQLAIRAA